MKPTSRFCLSQALVLVLRLVGAAPKATGKQAEEAADALPSLAATAVLATWRVTVCLLC